MSWIKTFNAAGLPQGVSVYYTGMPVFPRYLSPLIVGTDQKDISEEVRLVSDSAGSLQYVVGGFFRRDQKSYNTSLYAPGADAWNAATPAPGYPIAVYPNETDSTISNPLSESTRIGRSTAS